MYVTYNTNPKLWGYKSSINIISNVVIKVLCFMLIFAGKGIFLRTCFFFLSFQATNWLVKRCQGPGWGPCEGILEWPPSDHHGFRPNRGFRCSVIDLRDLFCVFSQGLCIVKQYQCDYVTWRQVVLQLKNIFDVHLENRGNEPNWLIFFKWVETTNLSGTLVGI